MGCYEKHPNGDILRLYLLWATNEVQAHRKAGIILRKHQNLWFDTLEQGAGFLDIYPVEQLLSERTTVTIYDQQYYQEL